VAALTVTLGYEVPPEAGRALILGVLAGIPDIARIPAPQTWLVSLGESGVVYQARFGLRDMGRRESIADTVLSQVWYAAQRAGYSFPYPHRTLVNARPLDPLVRTPEEIAAAVSGCDLFAVLDEAGRSALVSQARLKVYAPGETVVRQKDEGNSLFIVMKGELLVMADKVAVGTLGEGELFGERSLLTGEPRGATVTARDEVRLLEISAAAIGPVIRDNPALMEQLSEVLAHRDEANRESFRNAAARKDHTRKEEYLDKLRRFFGFND
jgi:CRP-like cAMP-binding protein